MANKLGRPKAKRENVISTPLTARELDDVRKVAVALDTTIAQFVRDSIARAKKHLKAAGKWPDMAERSSMMEDRESVKARWENACRRYLESEGAYSKEARQEMFFLCETLASVLGLPDGASAERVEELGRMQEQGKDSRKDGRKEWIFGKGYMMEGVWENEEQ